MRKKRRHKKLRLKPAILAFLILLGVSSACLLLFENLNTKSAKKQPAKTEKIVTKKTTAHKTSAKKPPKKVSEKPKPVTEKNVFLTFDDGPSPFLSRFNRLLQQEKIPATFFFIGENLNRIQPETAKAILASGSSIGWHSMTHDASLLYRKNNPTFLAEMEQVRALGREKLGITSNLIRAPYGSTYLSSELHQETKDKGFTLLDWNIDSNDWRYKMNSARVVETVLHQASALAKQKEPLVILMHERKNTLEALPAIIDALKKNGYSFQAYKENTPFKLNFRER
ncbi:polysaccharide deacetylase family protein [Listeria valentina]|uniref:polysaccharide deacetylase family protein n=1 Tax=Listeria valentina TaxID=2705293 RepID=UPI00142FA833|nr:polysaccharide deacetylase family protein [Listeria valentina]